MDYQITAGNPVSSLSMNVRGSRDVEVQVVIDGEMIDGMITLVPGLIDGHRKGLVAPDGDPADWVSAPLIEHVMARADHSEILRALVKAGREAARAAR